MINDRIVIVGAGHAGGTAAALLRRTGHQGSVVVVGEEKFAPYQRPPLSKAILKGDADFASLLLKAEGFYEANAIGLRLGAKAVAIDRDRKQVLLEDGETLPYDILVLATGSRALKLPVPGADLTGILSLRTIDDALSLKQAIGPDRTLAIVGGGYVGLEVAASARLSGTRVTLVERESRCLARVASAEVSAFFEARHRAEGVTIRTGVSVAAFEEGATGNVGALALSDGSHVPCEAVLVCIGARARDELAVEAGLRCDGGVIVDANARTSDPAIFAIGDMTKRPLPHYENAMFRLESVPNALEQAKRAVAAILGQPAPDPEVPWFWSDQYDVKMQIAGVPIGSERTIVRSGGSASSFAVFHLKGEHVVAVEAVNAPAEFMAGKRMIDARAAVSSERLRDRGVPAKDLMLPEEPVAIP